MRDSDTINEAVDLLECAGWRGYAKAVREQAAELAAYRAREGDVAAAVEAAFREGWDTAANVGDFDFIDNVDELREDNWRDSEARALLARRATATTATPAVEET